MQQHASAYSVLHTPSNPLGGVKGQNIFFKVVMLSIKLKGMEHRASCKHIFCPYTHSQPVGWIKRKKSEYGHIPYQIKEKKVVGGTTGS